ncbi:hypothetical protein A7J15_09430 [Microbacterium sediminis]|uniref:DUF559 domain-containing protein n=2 Tax=Microbacterium sediminis TaxID=904291 RepID=A0A1B9N9E1_9MICO|nr:hypothetical protein A7J15_09430 [Microbacterium sediminis]
MEAHPMTLRQELAARGGWCHRSQLIEAGWSRERLLKARRLEGIPLLRRHWLLLPEMPPAFHEAARVGGVVTCVSAIAPHELWIPPGLVTDQAHIAVASHAADRSAAAVTHRSRPVVTRPTTALLDPLENVLAHIAVCLPAEEAFAVWESAVRSGLRPEYLRSLNWTSLRARQLAASVTTLSDSGVESTFVWRCRRAGISVVQQVRIAGHRVDALIGRRLVVQLDGFAFHSDAVQRRRDIRHDRELTALGYTVLRFDYHDVMHDWPSVERAIRRAIALGQAG